jgi:hypothetical protein
MHREGVPRSSRKLSSGPAARVHDPEEFILPLNGDRALGFLHNRYQALRSDKSLL